jgi:hypothetical protein
MDDLTEALSYYPGSRSWWEEWGDRIHAEDPRERPQYYDVNFLNFLRDDGED